MAGRIENYRFSHRFKKQFKRLPVEIREAFKEKLSLFLNDMHHPSLRVKKSQGVENRWEGSIPMKYRFTFHLQYEGAHKWEVDRLRNGTSKRLLYLL